MFGRNSHRAVLHVPHRCGPVTQTRTSKGVPLGHLVSQTTSDRHFVDYVTYSSQSLTSELGFEPGQMPSIFFPDHLILKCASPGRVDRAELIAVGHFGHVHILLVFCSRIMTRDGHIMIDVGLHYANIVVSSSYS